MQQYKILVGQMNGHCPSALYGKRLLTGDMREPDWVLSARRKIMQNKIEAPE